VKYYFTLQFRMLNRRLSDFGLRPVFGYLAGIPLFAALTYWLFSASPYAGYLLVLAAQSLLLSLSNPERNLFLKSCFSAKAYLQLRLTENALLALPFLTALLVMQSFIPLLILSVSVPVFALVTGKASFQFTLPTPFGRKPFEFATGFRSTFYLVFLAFFLTVMAVVSGNFNLGIFSLLLIFLISLSYYAQPESPYFIWIYNLRPAAFLWSKIRTALQYSTLMSLPVTLTLGIAFPANLLALAGFLLMGYVFLLGMVLAKYAAWPERISLPEATLMALCAWFPPLLIVLIPYFSFKAVRRLEDLLS
jgi:hypothetical protein